MKKSILLLMLAFSILIVFGTCKKEEKEDAASGTLTDTRDGQTYKWVKIGNQVWMVENLRATKYNDGTAIHTGHTHEQWENLNTPAYAIYPHDTIDGLNSDMEVLQAYGALYNHYAVTTGKLCPAGWHVATDAEWSALISFAGGAAEAGDKLKSTRAAPLAHPRWESIYTEEKDPYGFSALPGGWRWSSGEFGSLGKTGRWWSSTESRSEEGLCWIMTAISRIHSPGGNPRSGYSIRCVKDN